MNLEEVVKELLWNNKEVQKNCYPLYVSDLELLVILDALRSEKKAMIEEGTFHPDDFPVSKDCLPVFRN